MTFCAATCVRRDTPGWEWSGSPTQKAGDPLCLHSPTLSLFKIATTLCFTAQPDASCPAMADHVVHIPAQTMANDVSAGATSVLPMGSLYEGAQYVLYEGMILKLKEKLGVTGKAMRDNHTNLE